MLESLHGVIAEAVLKAGLLAQEAAPEAPIEGKTLLEHIHSGGLIGYVIILLSFVGLALAVAHLVMIRESRLAPDEIVERVNELLKANKVRDAIRFCQAQENQCFFTRVVGTALVRCARSPFGFLELKSALEEAGQQQVARLYRATDGIGLIASVAPMLGLLGTVVGMVGAFEVISTTEGFAKPDQLAGDISQALITTVLGLIVAIPATAVFAYFRNRIDAVTGEVAELIEDVSVHLEGAAGKAPGAAPPAPPGRGRPRGVAPTPAPAPGPTAEGARTP